VYLNIIPFCSKYGWKDAKPQMSDMCTFMSISNIENLGFEICGNGLANINWIKPKINMQIQNKFEYYDKSPVNLYISWIEMFQDKD